MQIWQPTKERDIVINNTLSSGNLSTEIGGKIDDSFFIIIQLTECVTPVLSVTARFHQ